MKIAVIRLACHSRSPKINPGKEKKAMHQQQHRLKHRQKNNQPITQSNALPMERKRACARHTQTTTPVFADRPFWTVEEFGYNRGIRRTENVLFAAPWRRASVCDRACC